MAAIMAVKDRDFCFKAYTGLFFLTTDAAKVLMKKECVLLG